MNNEQIIEKVKEFCKKAHGSQLRKISETELYYNHPFRVMEDCKKHTDNLLTLCTALLHDVIEDTNVNSTMATLELFNYLDYNQSIITVNYVNALTRQPLQTEEEYNKQLLQSSDRVKLVKLMDIYDNCSTLHKVPDQKYAYKYLNKKLDMIHLLDTVEYHDAFNDVVELLEKQKELVEENLWNKLELQGISTDKKDRTIDKLKDLIPAMRKK